MNLAGNVSGALKAAVVVLVAAQLGVVAFRAAAAEPSPGAGCDHAASARAAGSGRALGEKGAYGRAIAAYTHASDLLAGCAASDRAGRIGAYVEAGHAVIAGATLAASSPRGAADEARLVRRATALRARVDLADADAAQRAAVAQADRWVELARGLPQTAPHSHASNRGA